MQAPLQLCLPLMKFNTESCRDGQPRTRLRADQDVVLDARQEGQHLHGHPLLRRHAARLDDERKVVLPWLREQVAPRGCGGIGVCGIAGRGCWTAGRAVQLQGT